MQVRHPSARRAYMRVQKHPRWLATLGKLENQKAFDPDETILLYLTGNATKYLDVLEMRRENKSPRAKHKLIGLLSARRGAYTFPDVYVTEGNV